jgi:hypothetical protein
MALGGQPIYLNGPPAARTLDPTLLVHGAFTGAWDL